jgi:hypothetical protein
METAMRRILGTALAMGALTMVLVVLSDRQVVGQDDPPPKKKKDDKDGPPRKFELGKVLPPPLLEELDLTPDQLRAIDELQREVKAKLEKILTPEQRKKVENFRPKGPPPPKGEPKEKKDKGPEKDDKDKGNK